MQKISKFKPIILNFDDLFMRYELQIVKRFDLEDIDGQTVSNAILAYSKSQNGSKQFFRALESTILANCHKMSP